MAENGVLVKIAADASAFEETLGGLGEKLLSGLAGVNPAIAGIIGLVGGIGAASIEVAEQYEEATNTIIAKTGATGDALEGLKGDWEAVFKADGAHDAETIATAVSQVNVALGLTGEPLQAASKGFLDLADNLKEQVEPLLTNTTKAMNAWGISADQATTIQDKLLVVSQNTGANLTQLSATLAQGEPILKQWGLSFDESATLLGEFEKNGLSGESAISSLQKAIAKLPEGLAPSKDAFLGLIEGIKDAGSESEGNAKSIELFGRSGAQMAQVIRDGKIDIDSLADSLNNSQGAVEAMDAKTDSFSEKMTQLWRNVSSLLEPLGTGLIEAGKGALDVINSLFSGTSGLNQAFQSVTTFLAPLIDSFQNHFGPVLKDVGTFITGVLVSSFLGLIDVLKLLWDPVLKTGIDLFQTYLLPVLNSVYDGIGKLVGVLKNVPGFSQVFKDGADAIALITPATKDASDSTDKLNAAHGNLAGTMNGQSKPAILDISGAIKNAKDAKELLTKATGDLEAAERQIADVYKSLSIPVVEDLATAEANQNDARVKALQSADDVADAEQKLNDAKSAAIPNAKALKAAEDDLAQKIKDSKAATEDYNQATKDLNVSKAFQKDATSLIEQAEKDYTDAVRSLHVPAIKDYTTALNDVKDAKDRVRDAANNLKDAEQALANLQKGDGEKSTVDIKTAEDNLSKARIALTTATKDRTAKEKELTDSEKTLDSANKLLLTGEKALDDLYKNDLTGHIKDLKTELDNLRAAKDKTTTAANTLTTAEKNLKAALATGDIEAVTKAEHDYQGALDGLSAATKEQHNQEQIVQTDYGVSKQAIDQVKSSTDGYARSQQDAVAAMSSLGITSQQAYKDVSDKATAAYALILSSGTASSTELRQAQIADLNAIKDKWVSQGKDVPADQQVLLAALTQQEKDYQDNSVKAWGTMWSSIHDAVAGAFKTLNTDLVTGNWSDFKKNIIGDLQSIGEAVVTKFLKPAEDAIESFISTTLTDLLSGKGLGGVMDSLGKIGTSIAGIFSGGSSVASTATGVAGTATSAAGSAAGAAGSIGTAASSGTSAATSAVGSTLSSVASISGIVTGVISAGTGIFSAAVENNMKDTLNAMHNDTSYLAWNFDQGGLHEAILTTKNNIDNFVNGAFGGWYHDYLLDQGTLALDMAERSKDWLPAIDDLNSKVCAKLDALIAQPVIVNNNIKNYLDGKDIASLIETQIETAIRQAIA